MPLLSFRVGWSWQAWETQERHKIQVDWTGSGLFDGDYDDVTADVIGEVHTTRGLDGDSLFTMRAQPGSLSATLRNPDGKYSSLKATSPLYGLIRPDLLVRAWHVAPTTAMVGTFKLDSLQTMAVGSDGEPTVRLRAVGRLASDFGQFANRVTAGPLNGALPGEVVANVLDALGVSAADRDLDEGTVPVAHWWKQDAPARETVQEMEEHDFGRFWEKRDGSYRYEDRYARLDNVSYLTFSGTAGSDTPPSGAHMDDSLRRIFNRAVVTLHPHTESTVEEVLWEASTEDQHYIGPGASVTYIAHYSDGYVNPWTDPVSGTDVVSATGTLVVSGIDKQAQTMTFVVTNSHVSAAATLTTLQARGYGWVEAQTYQVEEHDGDGPYRTYPLPSPYYTSRVYAEDSAAFIVLSQKDPHPLLDLEISAGPPSLLTTWACFLDISDRVTVEIDEVLTQFGIDATDYFIESIEQVFGPPGVPWKVRYKLSPAFDGLYDLDAWQLGVAGHSELGDTTAVVY